MKRHLHNASWSGISAFFRAVYGVANVLLAIRLLGADAYGSVATLLAWFVLYLSLNSSVFTVLVVSLMASKPGALERAEALGASSLLTIASVVFLLAGAALLGANMQGATAFERGLGGRASEVTILMALLVSAQIVVAYQSSLLESAGRLDIAMKWQLVGPAGVLVVLLVVFLTERALSPAGYIAVLLFGAVIDLSLIWRARRRVMRCAIPFTVSRSTVRALWTMLKSGGKLQGALLMNMFVEPLNKLLLHHFLGGAAVSLYDLAMKVIWGIQSLFSAAMRVFLHMSGESGETFSRRFSFVVQVMGVPAVLLHVVGVLFLAVVLHHWLRLDSVVLLTFFAVATISNLAMIFVTPLYVGLIGRGDLGFIFRTQAILAATNVLASYVMIPVLGVIGAAIGLFAATAYNAAAIFMRSRAVLGQLGGLKHALWASRFRYLAAAAVFAASMVWGLSGAESWLIPGILLSTCMVIAASDPALVELVKRFVTGVPADRRNG